MGMGAVLLQFANMATTPDVAPLCRGGEIGDQFDTVMPSLLSSCLE